MAAALPIAAVEPPVLQASADGQVARPGQFVSVKRILNEGCVKNETGEVCTRTGS